MYRAWTWCSRFLRPPVQSDNSWLSQQICIWDAYFDFSSPDIKKLTREKKKQDTQVTDCSPSAYQMIVLKHLLRRFLENGSNIWRHIPKCTVCQSKRNQIMSEKIATLNLSSQTTKTKVMPTNQTDVVL